MKYFKNIVVGGLCLSLVSNYMLFTKLDSLDNQLNNISNNHNQVIGMVNSQIGTINNAINEIKEEQSWLSPVKVDTVIDETDKNKVILTFEWQVKELHNNSKVLFNYKQVEGQEYKSIKAEDKGNGFFRVVMPVAIKSQPNWIYRIVDRGDSSEKQMRAVEEAKEAYERENQLSFHYYVSLSHGDIIKSGEINVASIDDMASRIYGYLEVHTDISRDRTYSLSVTSGKQYDTAIYLKEAFLKKYRDGQLIEELELKERRPMYENGEPARGDDTKNFYTEPSEEKLDYNSLVIKVKYSDGSTFEKEVYQAK